MDRYAGKPFLRLLECYVLDAIGHLDPGQRQVLERMQPKLASTYETSGTWVEIVARQMDFPDSLPAQIAGLWKKNVDAAAARGVPIDPNEFACALVDDNFPIGGS
ncbi:MAG TPA: hypothetical protein VJT80_12150 [Steroidobacteraceae bacterium]|nr:hypothetical protein [Steroidobacteraceae bacterium]